ncbi:succinylglutamate desuccinylase [Rheinheimera sp. 4Y26]|uniref:succinylglutamate desuccinylase n=1 Tax=Rheinheimera sp. 4Y26 TaxID=2977811 RepID=UPI0021B1383C|nr:succinylglutamate desuccinylase [Rheinheimera sp. 4Y26]MCT6699430.1 succinylglutamate desuccinylase [Rheinheimera sp. 4Y26]
MLSALPTALPQVLGDADFLAFTLKHPHFYPATSFVLQNGTKCDIWDTGVICFTPVSYGNNDIVLSSGVHGNETAPIEICAELVKDILLQKLQLSERVLFLFGNPPAMNAGVREIKDNMNRFFSGAHQIDAAVLAEAPSEQQAEAAGLSFEKLRCARLEQYVSRFYQAVPEGRNRALYDLHTAIRGSKFEKFAVYPYLHGKPWSEQQLTLWASCGVNTFLLMQTPATTFSYYGAQQHNAHAFTLELGKARPFGQNDHSRFADVALLLRNLISGVQISSKTFAEQDFHLFEVYRAINKKTEAFELCFAADIENFTQFAPGTVLARDEGIEYVVEQPGEALIFPNAKVAIGQRAMLMVKPISVAGRTA